jgi:hypothetical protein
MMATGPKTGPPMLGRVPSVVGIVGGLDVYPVDARSRVMEHRGALGRRVACGQPLEGVIQPGETPERAKVELRIAHER